ncbi:hypothetical protein PRIPAC_82788 [Pristionchus pacificus]|nr:hypothetical protein PRIPAC_82788 [Pristionchus pacificus]
MSFGPQTIIHLRKEVVEYSISGTRTLVVPQTGMKLMKKSCIGIGNVNVSTGAGVNENENRYPYHSWTCAAMPETLVFFDTVITIETDGDVVYTVEASSDLNTPIPSSAGDSIFIFTSGLSNDQQNMRGYNHRAKFQMLDESQHYVTVDMNLIFDNMDSMVGFKAYDFLYEYYHGRSTDKYLTDYFEVLYQPVGLKADQIGTSKDNVVIELHVATDAFTAAATRSTAKTVVPITATSNPTPVGQDPYCNCAVDKFGFPDGWNFDDIWLDIVFILDTSEAMSESKLQEAGTLIESFISDGVDDYLVTDPTKQFYARVGVLYDLNMTKADSIRGKATIKKGLKEINIVDAFDAAMNMFTSGYNKQPSRIGTRPVIYYMTPIHFLEKGQVELPLLKELASDGYYFANTDSMEGLQAFCKANCFCDNYNKEPLGGSDPAIVASGGCYHAVPSGVHFNNAKETCMIEGGFIATVHDDEKGRYLQQLMAKESSKSSFYWIGYQKSSDGVFEWEDKSTNPYTNWDIDEPSKAVVAKCAYVDATSPNLAWGAGNCQLGFPYVCQYAPCSVGNKDCLFKY